MNIPESAIITREEADRRCREAIYHTIVVEGNYALHSIFDPVTGITTIVRDAIKVHGRWVSQRF